MTMTRLMFVTASLVVLSCFGPGAFLVSGIFSGALDFVRPGVASAEELPLPKGVVSEKPRDGIAVPVGDRFMVAYTESIPGTDLRFDMIPVPAGTFLLGSPEDEPGHKGDEGPQVSVNVDPMWVGKLEVTQGEYREFEMLYSVFVEIENEEGAADGKHPDVVTAPTPIYDPMFRYEWGEGPAYPATSMTQFAAQQYTKWLSAMTRRQYRLPTEAEWEYACRAGSKAAFAWGDDANLAPQYAWFFDNSPDGYSVGGKKKPNAFGLHDMHGNVAEWTVNSHTSDGYEGWQATEPVTAVDLVLWPKKSTGCVVRGGSWEFELNDLRAASRLVSQDDQWKEEDPMLPTSPWWFTSDPARGVGFRLFRSYQDLPRPQIDKFWDHTSPEVKEYVEVFVEMGRGHIGILNEALVPKMAAFRKKREIALQKRKERLKRIRSSRPD